MYKYTLNNTLQYTTLLHHSLLYTKLGLPSYLLVSTSITHVCTFITLLINILLIFLMDFVHKICNVLKSRKNLLQPQHIQHKSSFSPCSIVTTPFTIIRTLHVFTTVMQQSKLTNHRVLASRNHRLHTW